MSLNRVQLIGRLGRDPEIVTFQNGKKAAKFPFATSESWKDKQTGERKEKTEWHNVVVYSDGLVDTVNKYIRKGAHLYIEGQIATRSWDDAKSGDKRYMTEIVLNNYSSKIQMLGKKSDNADNGNANADTAEAPQTDAPSPTEAPASAGAGDDDIPF